MQVRLSALVVLTGIVLAQTGCGLPVAPDTEIRPLQAYRIFVDADAVSIPSDVHELQVRGADWMDYVVFCRFRCSDATIDRILARGYLPDEAAAPELAGLPRRREDDFYTSSFDPPWNPAAATERYVRRIESETFSEVLCLAIHRHTGTVYATGSGSPKSPTRENSDKRSQTP